MTERVLIVKPELNRMLCGTIEWAGAQRSVRYPDKVEIKVEATWENAATKDGEVVNGLASIYLPWKAAEQLCAAGVISQQQDPMKFDVQKGTRFWIMRDASVTKDDKTVHNWSAQAIDLAGQPIKLERRPAPKSPLDAAAGAPVAPAQPQPVAPPAQAAPPAAQAAPPATKAAPVEAQAPTNGNGAAERDREVAVKIDRCYALAVSIAMYRLMQVTGKRRADIDQRTVQAGAATIMIALDRGMYMSSSGAVAKAMLEKIEALDKDLDYP